MKNMYNGDIFGHFGWLYYYFFTQQDEPSRESNHSEWPVDGLYAITRHNPWLSESCQYDVHENGFYIFQECITSISTY